MKKQPLLSVLMLSILVLSSCSNSIFLDRPEDTILEFWITQKVSSDDFKGYEYLPGWFGAEEYLDSRYNSVLVNEMARAPDIHVTYVVTNYPDYSSPDTHVTRIHITDPAITVYGISLDSNLNEITTKMKSLGFKQSDEDGRKWSKNNCTLSFRVDDITLSAFVSNKDGLVF